VFGVWKQAKLQVQGDNKKRDAEISEILYEYNSGCEERSEYSRRLTSDSSELKEFQDGSG